MRRARYRWSRQHSLYAADPASERFYRRLLENRLCGPVIREWREHRSVPRRAKRTAIAMIMVTFGVTITFFLSGLLARGIVAVVGVGVFAIVWRLPVRDPEPGLDLL